jgi:hypothetical protein
VEPQKGRPAEWRVRKTAYLESLRKKTDVAPLRVSCADKLHNARAILADYEIEGERGTESDPVEGRCPPRHRSRRGGQRFVRGPVAVAVQALSAAVESGRRGVVPEGWRGRSCVRLQAA